MGILFICAFILLVHTSIVPWVVADGQCTSDTIGEYFVLKEIVPDVVTSPPTGLVALTYDSGVEASCGNELTPTQMKVQPNISFEAETDSYYLLALTDPDNIPGTEWDHWLVGNIPDGNLSEGEVLSQYIGSAPSEGSGLHRYVITVFKQLGKLEFDEQRLNDSSTEGRYGFSTQALVEKYNLGEPVAGNFYLAQYDEYVDEIYKRLGVA